MFYPFEMTPLYSGAPCNFSNYTASAAKGGGLVEPLGFNAQLTQPPAQPLPVGVPQVTCTDGLAPHSLYKCHGSFQSRRCACLLKSNAATIAACFPGWGGG